VHDADEKRSVSAKAEKINNLIICVAFIGGYLIVVYARLIKYLSNLVKTDWGT
jgi:hypothetical protein